MATVTLGIKVDESLRIRIKEASTLQGKTPHWLIKQAVMQYVESVERGQLQPLVITGATHAIETPEPDLPDELSPPATALFSAPQPFLDWAQNVLPQTDMRAAITAAWHRPEPECLPLLVQLAHVTDPAQRAAIEAVGTRLVEGLRANKDSGGVEALVQEFSLSSQEGVALMCMAEALLRIPDNATRDALIRDKISHGDWHSHLGNSPSMFVNAAVWGLMLTGKLIKSHDLVLAMTAAHKDEIVRRYPRAAKKTQTLVEYAGFGHDDIADPYGRDDLFYFEVFKLIKTAVQAALEKLKKK